MEFNFDRLNYHQQLYKGYKIGCQLNNGEIHTSISLNGFYHSFFADNLSSAVIKAKKFINHIYKH